MNFFWEIDGSDHGINCVTKIETESGRYKALYLASTIPEKTGERVKEGKRERGV
jgi:hypothetical protein